MVVGGIKSKKNFGSPPKFISDLVPDYDQTKARPALTC